MTEAEWRCCTKVMRMLRAVGDRANERKLRLFACAGVRRLDPLSRDSRRAVEVAERCADGLIPNEEWRCAYGIASRSLHDRSTGSLAYAAAVRTLAEKQVLIASITRGDAAHAAARTSAAAYPSRAALYTNNDFLAARGKEACILRCLFGPVLFRSISVDPVWLRGPVPHIAEAIYADHAFNQMPVLADALVDAGCTDPDLLAHCRGRGPHARGCWVLDLLTGRG